VARWWRTYRGDLVKDLIIGVVVGVLLLFGAMWWDAKLVDRQDVLAKSIADRQDGLARDLAHQAEVLENTRFVRQLATSNTKASKPFANINLEGAQLGGLELACTGAGPSSRWVRRFQGS
jgi:predicted negative regulator of RcsB-dependent stress response